MVFITANNHNHAIEMHNVFVKKIYLYNLSTRNHFQQVVASYWFSFLIHLHTKF